ncbi:adenylate/guanylate cyclase domain-containing protein [Actinomarinicola tropica]|uniref:Guanylate cyclase domain-containing protein n=1 Tax=Actinomarinicola tropica TaxID=2789776 RepID=A0A5Q2RK18_9ACTN|nr:adenylate/guanylate cyclase domain-containing protein [Actinomarinicola tropica]QGG94911.1 hypothetical protein GH723_07185 [Actinomarinicola tropica]
MAVDVAADAVVGTVVFTDIVGFTAFTADEGDDRALELLAVQERAVERLLPDGARVVKELGDGLMLWFPDPVGAITTALALHATLADHDLDGFPLWIRAGAHHGTQRRRRDDLLGHDVNVAARIVDLAGPGELLVSEATRRAIGGGLVDVEFREVGPVFVKGLADPVWIHHVEPLDDTTVVPADPPAAPEGAR